MESTTLSDTATRLHDRNVPGGAIALYDDSGEYFLQVWDRLTDTFDEYHFPSRRLAFKAYRQW